MSSTITALTSGGGLAMAGDTSGQLELKTNNGTTAVTITTAQNVGIGTTTPVSNGGYGGLTLNGTSGSIYSMMYNGTENLRLFAGNNEGSIQYSSAGVLTFVDGVSGGTERMRIDADGKVCIGINGAQQNAMLSVTSGTGNTSIALKGDSGTNCGSIYYTSATNGNKYWQTAANQNNFFIFAIINYENNI